MFDPKGRALEGKKGLVIGSANRKLITYSGAQDRKKPTSPGIPPGKLMIIALSR